MEREGDWKARRGKEGERRGEEGRTDGEIAPQVWPEERKLGRGSVIKYSLSSSYFPFPRRLMVY